MNKNLFSLPKHIVAHGNQATRNALRIDEIHKLQCTSIFYSANDQFEIHSQAPTCKAAYWAVTLSKYTQERSTFVRQSTSSQDLLSCYNTILWLSAHALMASTQPPKIMTDRYVDILLFAQHATEIQVPALLLNLPQKSYNFQIASSAT